MSVRMSSVHLYIYVLHRDIYCSIVPLSSFPFGVAALLGSEKLDSENLCRLEYVLEWLDLYIRGDTSSVERAYLKKTITRIHSRCTVFHNQFSGAVPIHLHRFLYSAQSLYTYTKIK